MSSVMAATSLLAWFLMALITTALAFWEFGNPAVWRENNDSQKRAIIIIDPSQRIQKPGIVTGWHVYTTRSRRSQTVNLQIWRPVHIERREYYLVSQTVFKAQWIGHNFIPLFPQDRIHARVDDVIGIYFPRYNPVPWVASPCRDGRGNAHYFKYNPKHLTLNKTFIMDSAKLDWEPCRIYSVNATMMTPQELARFDNSNTTFTSPNNRGLHGKTSPTKMPYHSQANTYTSSYMFAIIALIFSTHIPYIVMSPFS